MECFRESVPVRAPPVHEPASSKHDRCQHARWVQTSGAGESWNQVVSDPKAFWVDWWGRVCGRNDGGFPGVALRLLRIDQLIATPVRAGDDAPLRLRL